MLHDEFARARSRCIDFHGKTVCLYDKLEAPARCTAKVRFESTNSEWRQGIWLGQMVRKSRLRLTVGEVTAPGMVLWVDTSPPEVVVRVDAPDGILHLYNVWDVGDERRQSQVDGAGMLIEEVSPTLRRYHCNDGHPEPTFNHLVFSLEIEI